MTWEKRPEYKCRSWRHDGECRRWRAAQNFARVSAALAPHRFQDVVYLVLTLDRNNWKDRWEAFDQLTRCWSALAKAIARDYGEGTWKQVKEKDGRTRRRRVSRVPDWVGTVEVHRSGWPHLNIVMVSPHLGDAVASDLKGTLQWLKRHAVMCGFGWRCSIERAMSKRALAGYVVKVAGEVERAASPDASGRLVGEVVKLSQLPVDAKRHFRRLRSSVGFLPKPFKNPDVGGELVRAPSPGTVQGAPPEPFELEHDDAPPKFVPPPPLTDADVKRVRALARKRTGLDPALVGWDAVFVAEQERLHPRVKGKAVPVHEDAPGAMPRRKATRHD